MKQTYYPGDNDHAIYTARAYLAQPTERNADMLRRVVGAGIGSGPNEGHCVVRTPYGGVARVGDAAREWSELKTGAEEFESQLRATYTTT